MARPRGVALVTGASRGIGRAIAVRLAREGYAVAVNYRKRSGEAEETVRMIREEGGEARAYRADVSDEKQVEEMFNRVEEELGRVSVLVNNAGWGLITPVAQMTADLWDRHIAVNLRSAFLTSRRAIPAMVEQGWGRIINISSVAALIGIAGLAAYSAAKAGLIGLTRALANELRGTGVTVNAIAAGFVWTKMAQSFFQATGLDPDAWAKKWTLTGKIPQPEEVAELVAYLASPAADNITGQVIVIDSGLTIAAGSTAHNA